MDKIEEYKELAERNGWDFSLDSNNIPYFMKFGEYAVPNDKTTKEDKELLASIISEGSEELKKLVLMCWDNKIIITGPCSGISKFHDYKTFALHFGLIAPSEIVIPLQQKLFEIFPNFNHLCREKDDMIRYDINYFIRDKELTEEESNSIFKTISDEMKEVLGKEDIKGRIK